MRRGFTLVEALITIVVLAIIASVAASLVLDSVDDYLTARSRGQLHAELSIAMDRIMRDLRKIPLDVAAATVAPDIDTTSATSCTFDGGYYVTYSAGDKEVQLWDGAAAIVLLTDVDDLTFRYFNDVNTEIGPVLAGAACDPIRRIEISITLDRYGVQETLRSKVFLRCTLAGAGA
jgi:prepilin-type N-terminal cleavage/methylation domain-containing protein